MQTCEPQAPWQQFSKYCGHRDAAVTIRVIWIPTFEVWVNDTRAPMLGYPNMHLIEIHTQWGNQKVLNIKQILSSDAIDTCLFNRLNANATSASPMGACNW